MPSSPLTLIAVVDDDRRILESVARLLESADYEARSFTSGAALLTSGCVAKIDCLISDLSMPEMDGFELARAVRAARPDLPVIFITAHAELANRSQPVGINHYALLRKPFDGEGLLAAIRDMLR